MDKLRALHYFVNAADQGSLSGAARELEISVPAVAKMINALERELTVKLFERGKHGLAVTADGQAYLDACRPLLEQLLAADESVRSAAIKPRGTVVVGAPSFIAQHCLLPALPALVNRHPDIEIDLRVVNRVTEPAAAAVEVFVVLGWPDRGDLVHRRIGQTRFVVCAAPSYWAAHGVPAQPADLARHTCLLFRNPEATLLDLWRFERGETKHEIQVRGWLQSDHRDALLDAALAGHGVIRTSSISISPHLGSGRLVPVLLDWTLGDAPPVNLLFRPHQRRTPRVRVFAEFATALFRDLDPDQGAAGRTLLPDWYRRRYARVSAALRSPSHGR